MKLRLDGFDLAYRFEGPASAPVATFCHSLGADSGMWDEQMPALAGYRVLRLDMRGHGASDAPPGPYTLRTLAADVVQAWDRLDVDRSHFVGLSIGGMIGQALGIHYGDRLLSLMLCDTRCSSGTGQLSLWDDRIAHVRRAGSLEPLIETTLSRWFSDAFFARDPGRIEQVRAMLRRCSVEGYAGCGKAVADFDFADDLPSIGVRTMVVVGRDDPGTTVADAETIHRAVSGSQLRIIEKCRHLPNVEDPDAFNAILAGWLQ